MLDERPWEHNAVCDPPTYGCVAPLRTTPMIVKSRPPRAVVPRGASSGVVKSFPQSTASSLFSRNDTGGKANCSPSSSSCAPDVYPAPAVSTSTAAMSVTECADANSRKRPSSAPQTASDEEPRAVDVLTPSSPLSEGFLIPAADPSFADKLVVVLDLDETLVSSRSTGAIVRPGTDLLLQTLKGRCELIVWTAGLREYALDVIRQIDPYSAINHCVYRLSTWWNGKSGCVKDIRMLGRPLQRTVFIDNTPDVFQANPDNSILVSDFDGTGSATDRVLVTLADVFEEVFRRFPNPTAADVLSSHHIKTRKIPLDNGTGCVSLNTVAGDFKVFSRPRGPAYGTRYPTECSYR